MPSNQVWNHFHAKGLIPSKFGSGSGLGTWIRIWPFNVRTRRHFRSWNDLIVGFSDQAIYSACCDNVRKIGYINGMIHCNVIGESSHDMSRARAWPCLTFSCVTLSHPLAGEVGGRKRQPSMMGRMGAYTTYSIGTNILLNLGQWDDDQRRGRYSPSSLSHAQAS